MTDRRERIGVGRLIRARRDALGMSQVELEARSGVAQRTISRIENTVDLDYLPEARILVPLADALGLSVADLVSEAGYPVQEEPSAAADDTQIYTSAMRDIDRLELPERVKRMMREAVEYARELSEQESREP